MSQKVSSQSQSSKKRSTRAKERHSRVINTATPFEILRELPERINPAILLAEEMMQKGILGVLDFEVIERAQETLLDSRREIERVETQFAALVKTPASPGEKVPIGF